MPDRTRADSPTKTCAEPDCDRPLRARGLCSTHYNQHQPNRHRREKVCVACGTAYVTTRTDGRFCSLFCRDYTRCGPLFSLLPIKREPKPEPNPPFREARECAWCGATFVAHRDTHTNCSKRCKRKAIHMRRRGRESIAGGTYTWAEVIRLLLAFDRCCAYCEQPIVGQPDPDHVVPLSRGGSNSITNILPCCSLCNSDKRDLLLSEWALDRARRGLPTRITSWSPDDCRIRGVTAISSAA